VRVLRDPRQRDGEELVDAAIAVRREDERLAVGRQLRAGLIPRTLRDVVFRLGFDVVQIDIRVLLVVPPAVDDPVGVGRVLGDGETTGVVVRELAGRATGDVNFVHLVVRGVGELLRVRRPDEVVLFRGLRGELLARRRGDVVDPDLLLAAL